MKLIDYISKHFESMKQDLEDDLKYELGVRIYRISEYNFEDFTPQEFVSETIKKGDEFDLFRKIKNRKKLNKDAKKVFKKRFKFDHMVPKKEIIKKFKECKTAQQFENIIRENLIHAFITPEEDALLNSFGFRSKGRDTPEKAFAAYDKAGIKINKFKFD